MIIKSLTNLSGSKSEKISSGLKSPVTSINWEAILHGSTVQRSKQHSVVNPVVLCASLLAAPKLTNNSESGSEKPYYQPGFSTGPSTISSTAAMLMKNGRTVVCDMREQRCKLFIGGVPLNSEASVLRDHFSAYGEVIDAAVMRDRASGRSRGFGFVTFRELSSVDAAQAARPHFIDSKLVETKRAMPREDSANLESHVTTTRLLVCDFDSKLVDQAALTSTFSKFGTIVSCKILGADSSGSSAALLLFDDYDPIDHILLHRPHCVAGRPVTVRKALTKEQKAEARQKQSQLAYRYQQNGILFCSELTASREDEKVNLADDESCSPVDWMVDSKLSANQNAIFQATMQLALTDPALLYASCVASAHRNHWRPSKLETTSCERRVNSESSENSADKVSASISGRSCASSPCKPVPGTSPSIDDNSNTTTTNNNDSIMTSDEFRLAAAFTQLCVSVGGPPFYVALTADRATAANIFYQQQVQAYALLHQQQLAASNAFYAMCMMQQGGATTAAPPTSSATTNINSCRADAE